jgi:hypothetical protein
MASFIQKYLSGGFWKSKKNHAKHNDEGIKRLEELTAALTREMNPPEHTIMDTIMEFSDRGVLGFDVNGTILFNNTSSYTITKLRDSKGKSIFDVIDKDGATELKRFMDSEEISSSIKIEVDEGDKRRYYDMGIFRITNGKVWFVIFCINCLERAMFEIENCPIKDNCPFHNRCIVKGLE